jgi:hypothetical protein
MIDAMQHVRREKRPRRLPAALLAAILIPALFSFSARAHEGPPFPIVVDHEAGSMLVSIWTDPDIGTGTFFVVLEPTEGAELPGNLRVQVGVTPQSGRLDEALYEAEAQHVRYGARYFTEVAFDQGEWWSVRVVIESDAGSEVIASEVEATPDGTLGPISLVLFLLPFLAVGFLWLKAVLRRRKASSA